MQPSGMTACKTSSSRSSIGDATLQASTAVLHTHTPTEHVVSIAPIRRNFVRYCEWTDSYLQGYMIEFHVQKCPCLSRETFVSTHPAYSIALDGYVATESFLEIHPTGPYRNFNHYEIVDRSCCARCRVGRDLRCTPKDQRRNRSTRRTGTIHRGGCAHRRHLRLPRQRSQK